MSLHSIIELSKEKLSDIKNRFKLTLEASVIAVFLIGFLSYVYANKAEIPAFPGAEGFGAFTPGGRGGKVLFVTNLKDSGPGSLRAAIEASGPRTVVFRVSGTIELESDLEITNPYITIAGQTAPGDGICLKNYKLGISADDVIVRFLRVRRGRASGEDDDAITIRNAENVIVDYCSLSWGTDEILNTWHGTKNITVQWCIISEALHHKDHGYAASLGGVNSSYHHNLLANCPGRNPSIAGDNKHQTINMDFRNNVIFNFGYRTIDGKPTSVNIVNNYYKPGPNSSKEVFARIDKPGVYEKIPTTSWYVKGNVWEGKKRMSKNNAIGVSGATKWLVDEPNGFAPMPTESAKAVYHLVLTNAGATLPERDQVDTRIIKEARTGNTTYGKGVVLDPSNVGGWPDLSSAPLPKDLDKDGMPDAWETKFGLKPDDKTDGSTDKDGDGYTNLEEYLNDTNPTEFIDYTKPENNKHSLHRNDTVHSSRK